MADTTALGNAGEHLVMAELLSRGYQAFWADRGNTAYDVSVVAGEKHSVIRVRTSTSKTLNFKPPKRESDPYFAQMLKNDFVAFVILPNKDASIRSAQVYIVPTRVVDREIRRCHHHWIAQALSDEQRVIRMHTKRRTLKLDGKPTAKVIAQGYAKTWGRYLEAWHQLGAGKQP